MFPADETGEEARGREGEQEGGVFSNRCSGRMGGTIEGIGVYNNCKN